MPLRLKWERTWPDKKADFIARTDDGQSVGRIYKTFAPGGGYHWFWAGNGRYKTRGLTRTGICKSKMEAAEELEAAWFTMIRWADEAE